MKRIEKNYPESILNRLVVEIRKRLIALNRVGLGYLTLNRISPSLSRGESQRVRIALTLVNQLEDIVHILDEPTIGQHFVDVQKFLPVLSELPGPVIYIEHDRYFTAYADHVIDMGPGAGREGGKIIFNGTPQELWTSNTLTGQYFSLRKTVNIPKKRAYPQLFLRIEKAFEHNLKNIDVNIPLKRFTVITGVSGSGKSTLIEDVLYKSLKNKKPIGCERISPLSIKSKLVDQSPIGKNPRSNPATYTKISDIIRKFYADLSNFSPSHFSFNRSEGA
ncbi:MAG: excinuclease ABC subunit A, partial [Candidatus Lokiarchaeota archaeon]